MGDLKNQMWTNLGEIPGDGIDNDGNGFVDDIYGYDFVNGDSDPWDDHGHGTHCAGTIGAEANNGKGVAGVSWGPKIMALKFLNNEGSGYTSGAIAAIDYAVMMGAHLTSNSWGGGSYSRALEDAIRAANTRGQLFVVAAGNDGRNNDVGPTYPCNVNVENVICVAATAQNDQMASFSNYGAASVHIAAPGVKIYSTLPDNKYQAYSGTSMATPHVAGAAALVLDFLPTLRHAEVREILLDSADRLDTLSGKVATGRLNVHRALLRAKQMSWARIVGSMPSITVPSHSEGHIQLALTGTSTKDKSGNDLHRASLKLSKGSFERRIPVTLSVQARRLSSSIMDAQTPGKESVGPTTSATTAIGSSFIMV